MSTFRAVWPITDEAVTYADLCKQAMTDVPRLAAQAHARPNGVGTFIIAPSDIVPGSGRVTNTCLVYTVKASPIARPAFSTLAGKERTYATPDHKACDRCGLVRRLNRTLDRGVTALCRDCVDVERVTPEIADALVAGGF